MHPWLKLQVLKKAKIAQPGQWFAEGCKLKTTTTTKDQQQKDIKNNQKKEGKTY